MASSQAFILKDKLYKKLKQGKKAVLHNGYTQSQIDYYGINLYFQSVTTGTEKEIEFRGGNLEEVTQGLYKSLLKGEVLRLQRVFLYVQVWGEKDDKYGNKQGWYGRTLRYNDRGVLVWSKRSKDWVFKDRSYHNK